MERHTVIVAHNMLEKIEETERMLEYIESIEGKKLQIRTDDCPYGIPMPTNTIRDKVYEIIKTAYEDELKDRNERLKNLKGE